MPTGDVFGKYHPPGCFCWGCRVPQPGWYVQPGTVYPVPQMEHPMVDRRQVEEYRKKIEDARKKIEDARKIKEELLVRALKAEIALSRINDFVSDCSLDSELVLEEYIPSVIAIWKESEE